LTETRTRVTRDSASGCTVDQNQAQGGCAGDDEGGVIANLLSATTTLTSSTVAHNEASGGGGGGGTGLGGGADNDATSTLALYGVLITQNVAIGSPGIGGGIYTLGTFTFDASTVIKHNHASTSGNEIGP
jgi:hypothetical protein